MHYMLMRTRIFLAWAALVAPACVWAQGDEASMAVTLREVARTVVQATPSPEARSGNAGVQMQLLAIAGQLGEGNSANSAAQLDRVIADVSDPAARAKLTAIADQLRRLSKDRADALERQYQAVLADARKTLAMATKPKDLDPLARKASELLLAAQQFQGRDGSAQNAVARAEKLKQFVYLWQDLLAYLDAPGSPTRGVNADELAHLATQMDEIVPRAEILSRITIAKERAREFVKTPASKPPASDAVRALVARIHSMLDVETIYPQLFALQQEAPETTGGLPRYLRVLEAAMNTKVKFKSGAILRVPDDWTGSPNVYEPHEFVEEIAQLVEELRLLILPRYLGLERDPAALPMAGEGVDEYLNRVAQAALAAGDWRRFLRVRETVAQLTLDRRGRKKFTPQLQDNGALEQFVAAENLADAGQPMLAAMSYLYGLRLAGNTIPTGIVKKRVAALRSANASAVAAAEERVANLIYRQPGPDEPGAAPRLLAPVVEVPVPTPRPGPTATPKANP